MECPLTGLGTGRPVSLFRWGKLRGPIARLRQLKMLSPLPASAPEALGVCSIGRARTPLGPHLCSNRIALPIEGSPFALVVKAKSTAAGHCRSKGLPSCRRGPLLPTTAWPSTTRPSPSPMLQRAPFSRVAEDTDSGLNFPTSGFGPRTTRCSGRPGNPLLRTNDADGQTCSGRSLPPGSSS